MIPPYDNFVLGDGLLHWSYSRGRDRQGEKVMRIPTSTMTAIVKGNCLQNITLKNVSIKKSRIKRNFSQNNNEVNVALKSVSP